MTDEAKALVELQKAAGLKNTPTPLTHDLRIAVSGEGPRAYDWQDKPHRLLYDACAEIETQAREIERLRGVLKRWQYSGCPDCSGDCGSANPPVMCCIMEETRAALAGDSHD